MGKVKYNALDNSTLKKLLHLNNLAVFGNKAAMVARLTAHFQNVDDIDEEELKNLPCDDAMQDQIDELRNSLSQVLNAVQQLTEKSVNQNTLTNENNNNNHAVSSNSRESYLPSPIVNGSNSSNMLEGGIVKTSMRDVIAILPEYDPGKDYQTSQQFIDKVQSLQSAYGWDDIIVLYAIQSKLKGHARIWLDSQDVFRVWSDFVRAFLADFPCELNDADVHIDMMQRKQNKNESVKDYYYHMLAKGRLGKLNDQAIIRHMINGIANDFLRRTLNTRKFVDCPDFLKALLNSDKSGYHQSQYVPTYVKEYKNVDTENNTLKFTKNQKGPVCYNCNEIGHISVNCKLPQKQKRCDKCNKVHTKEKGCAVVRNTKMINDQLFQLIVSINGNKLSALVDTGSECSLIKKSVAKDMNLKLENCLMQIHGICGGIRYAEQKCYVELLVDNVCVSVNLYLIDDTLLTNDLLLGQNLFKNENLKLIIGNGIVKIEKINKEKSINMVRRVKIIDEQNIQCGLNDEKMKCELLETVNEFGDVFSDGLKQIGKTEIVRMKIEVNENEIVAQRPYRVPEPMKNVVPKLISELLETGIIVPSESSYASPILMVKKKDGGERLCVDYRRLNRITRTERFPTPNIEECLQEAAKFKLFTVLDLNSGYYQICIEPESRKYTAFITTEGLFEFNRMPFGLKNAPVNFLRLMAKIRDSAGKENMIHYMDDILVGANSFGEMIIKLRKVLNVLKEAGLTLNMSKCKFCNSSIPFLGHILTAGGIKPGTPKTAAIENFETPKSVTDVRRFLGLSGYFRKFVPAYSLMSEPLRKLLKKNVEFMWAKEQNDAFIMLKEKLISQPVMTAYRVEAEHEIHTDASSVGLAGVLLQRDDNELKPVAYYSRSTTETEAKFHSYELETLAVVETLERFRYYVCGKSIKVVTDCSAVKSAMEKRELIPRIARWWLKVQDFDMVLEHRQGSRMEHVDALSRSPNEESKETEVATLRIDKVTISHEDWLFSMQLQDKKLKIIHQKLIDKDKQTMNEYVNENGRLFKNIKGKKLWVVPKFLRWHMLCECHDKCGHLGVEKTLSKLQSYSWFPRMRSFTKSYVNSCVDCAYNKSKGGAKEGELHYNDVEAIPFRKIHIDHLGPFPKTFKRNEHILVIVDSFTKFTVIKAVKSTATKFVIPVLNEMFSYFGVPGCIVSDRGTAFTSKDFENYCNNNDIRHVLNAVRTPRANGHAERANRTILTMLTTTTKKEKQWDQHIQKIQWSLNTMINATTGKTPHELLFSFSPRDILQNKILLALSNDINITTEDMSEIRNHAVDKIQKQRICDKIRYDKRHATPTNYNCGDLVLVENEPVSTGYSRKLEPKFKGPFIVTKVLGNDRYVLEDLPNTTRTNRHYVSVHASDKIKRWCQLPPDDVDSGGDESSNSDIE